MFLILPHCSSSTSLFTSFISSGLEASTVTPIRYNLHPESLSVISAIISCLPEVLDFAPGGASYEWKIIQNDMNVIDYLLWLREQYL